MHRAEESGTTDNFTKYLAEAGDWKFEGGKAWTAPGGAAEQGNDGVGKADRGHRRLDRLRRVGLCQGQQPAVAEIDNGGGAVE